MHGFHTLWHHPVHVTCSGTYERGADIFHIYRYIMEHRFSFLSIGLGALDHNVRQAADHRKPANTHYRHGATRSPGSRALNREQRNAAHTHKMWHTRTIKPQTCPRRLHALPCCGTFFFCNRAAACPPFTTRDSNPGKSVKTAPWHA